VRCEAKSRCDSRHIGSRSEFQNRRTTTETIIVVPTANEVAAKTSGHFPGILTTVGIIRFASIPVLIAGYRVGAGVESDRRAIAPTPPFPLIGGPAGISELLPAEGRVIGIADPRIVSRRRQNVGGDKDLLIVTTYRGEVAAIGHGEILGSLPSS